MHILSTKEIYLLGGTRAKNNSQRQKTEDKREGEGRREMEQGYFYPVGTKVASA